MFALSWINGKKWRTWRKKSLMVDEYMLNKGLDKTEDIINIEEFDDTRFWWIQMINYQMILLWKMLW